HYVSHHSLHAYTTLFRSLTCRQWALVVCNRTWMIQMNPLTISYSDKLEALIRYAQQGNVIMVKRLLDDDVDPNSVNILGLSPCRSEEHTSELQSPDHLVC